MREDRNDLYTQVTAAEERITGRKFCTTCQRLKPTEGGVVKVTGKLKTVKRWRCAECASGTRRFV